MRFELIACTDPSADLWDPSGPYIIHSGLTCRAQKQSLYVHGADKGWRLAGKLRGPQGSSHGACISRRTSQPLHWRALSVLAAS